jgi:hypothetical protein
VLSRRRRHVPDAGRIQVSRRDDHMHARHLTRSVGIDRAQLAMRHPAAHHDTIELTGQVQIIGIAALATQQDRILLARDRLADGKLFVHQERGIKRRIHQGLAFVQGAISNRI